MISLPFEKHQPASVKNEYFAWITIHEDGSYNFLDKMPKNIERINRYVIEEWAIKEFFKEFLEKKIIYLCSYFGERSKSLTKVQRLFREKKLIKGGCKKSDLGNDIFVSNIKNIELIPFELINDYYYDSIFIISQKEFNSEEFNEVAKKLNLFAQPMNLGDYFPTEDVIEIINKKKIGIIYLNRHYFYWNHDKDRNVYVYYTDDNV